MMISDVMHQASSEHEIFFLLTAYVESLRYSDIPGALPEHLTRLPLSGTGDVHRRRNALRIELNTAAEHGGKRRAILLEAANVLGAALERLEWLQQEACLPSRRSGLRPSRQAA